MLNTLLDFEQFTQRAPSPLEARVILEALNEEKKAPVSVSLSVCVCVCVCVCLIVSVRYRAPLHDCTCACVCVSE